MKNGRRIYGKWSEEKLTQEINEEGMLENVWSKEKIQKGRKSNIKNREEKKEAVVATSGYMQAFPGDSDEINEEP
jgi:hypothetical protein